MHLKVEASTMLCYMKIIMILKNSHGLMIFFTLPTSIFIILFSFQFHFILCKSNRKRAQRTYYIRHVTFLITYPCNCNNCVPEIISAFACLFVSSYLIVIMKQRKESSFRRFISLIVWYLSFCLVRVEHKSRFVFGKIRNKK